MDNEDVKNMVQQEVLRDKKAEIIMGKLKDVKSIDQAKAKGAKVVEEGVKPLDIVTKRSVTNAIKVLMAAGGSTNLLIHLKAICRRAGIPLECAP